MTYNQWLRQKTTKDNDDRLSSCERVKPHYRYPIGKVLYVDNREMFDHFSSVRV